MLARLIRESEGPNPDFNPKFPKSTNNHPDKIWPVGTMLAHPMAWVHCCPDAKGIVRAEPADEECEQIVARKNAEYARVIEARQMAKTMEAMALARQQQQDDDDESLDNAAQAFVNDLDEETL
jgi:hypothetical protein